MLTYLLLKRYDKHTVFTLVNKDEAEKIKISIKHVTEKQGRGIPMIFVICFSLLYSTITLSNIMSKSELPNKQIISCNEITWCLAYINVLTEKQQHSFSMSPIFFSTKRLYYVNG